MRGKSKLAKQQENDAGDFREQHLIEATSQNEEGRKWGPEGSPMSILSHTERT